MIHACISYLCNNKSSIISTLTRPGAGGGGGADV